MNAMVTQNQRLVSDNRSLVHRASIRESSRLDSLVEEARERTRVALGPQASTKSLGSDGGEREGVAVAAAAAAAAAAASTNAVPSGGPGALVATAGAGKV